ncbi:nucleotidyltransferase [Aureispira sp. CCB-QB1]|uniref:nucleotidyltransferase domain-containing protein n=1 Tax=Aureispira sp. CCB-QB1 TaxID=1313421 RepID=UPI000698A52B|nr:nucleotidyltransferase [Aureispira sp. CCB-QB1]
MIVSQHQKTKEYSQLLEKISDEIDIPLSLYKTAEDRYKSVGEWLGRKDSALSKYSPHIYPQGSFLIGTVTKPIFEEDGCDIDLVCCLECSKDDTTWARLKEMVGDELETNGKYKNMLDEEKRRCWTLLYSGKEPIPFHLDILPAIPNEVFIQEDNPFRKNAILITDNVHKRFMTSNPKGYAEWFKIQMQLQKSFDYNNHVKLMAKSMGCQIEEVPTYALKTPLQRVIQILKRHRDIEYKDKSEEEREAKPISIIITTLAAKAYASIQSFVNDDLYTIAKAIIDEMPNHIENKKNSQGEYIRWIENPTDRTENFADKWESDIRREYAFREWLDSVKNTLEKAFNKQGVHLIGETLKLSFGERTINKALEEFHNERVGNHRKDGLLGVSGKNASLTKIDGIKKVSKVPKNTFYGEE